jgi:hypothetical protein
MRRGGGDGLYYPGHMAGSAEYIVIQEGSFIMITIRGKLFCIILLISITITCVFTIPYLFPPNQISISASYDYGFNNRVGIIMLALASLLILVFSFLWVNPNKIEIDFFNDLTKRVTLNKTFFIGVVFTIIGCGVLRYILGKDSYGIGESGYFIPRIHDITSGKTIYKDFDFIPGPIFLYFPYFVCIA